MKLRIISRFKGFGLTITPTTRDINGKASIGLKAKFSPAGKYGSLVLDTANKQDVQKLKALTEHPFWDNGTDIPHIWPEDRKEYNKAAKELGLSEVPTGAEAEARVHFKADDQLAVIKEAQSEEIQKLKAEINVLKGLPVGEEPVKKGRPKKSDAEDKAY